MNKTLLYLFLGFLTVNASLLQAQEFQVGLKGGINKTFVGEINSIKKSISEPDPTTFNATGEIGYHGGAWVQVNFGKFFIRPEVVYSALESRFDFPSKPSIYAIKELSVPVLIGYNIYGPVDIYAGLAYKNIIESTLEGNGDGVIPAPKIVVQNFPGSAQIGAKVEFGSFGLDVRYDHSLSSKENQPVSFFLPEYGVNDGTFDDARLNQLIVSLTVKLFDSENAGKKRRKGGNCYF